MKPLTPQEFFDNYVSSYDEGVLKDTQYGVSRNIGIETMKAYTKYVIENAVSDEEIKSTYKYEENLNDKLLKVDYNGRILGAKWLKQQLLKKIK